MTIWHITGESLGVKLFAVVVGGHKVRNKDARQILVDHIWSEWLGAEDASDGRDFNPKADDFKAFPFGSVMPNEDDVRLEFLVSHT